MEREGKRNRVFAHLILPQMEGNNVYNAYNISTNPMATQYWRGQYTAWNTVFTSWLCPSDGNNGGGRVTNGYYSGNQATANWGPSPINPATGTYAHTIPVSNYAGSFGDNYCGGVLAGGEPSLGNPVQWSPTIRSKSDRLERLLGNLVRRIDRIHPRCRVRCAASSITGAPRNHPTSPA